jgi:general secretion pathway protein M
MKAWLAGLEPRERMLVLVAMGVLVLLLVYAVLLQPFYNQHGKLRSSVAEQHETLQWMQQNAATVRQLQGSGQTASTGLAGRSLLSVADASARSAGLGPALKRVEPEGSSGVRVWMDGAVFDSVIGWLDSMGSQYGVDIESVTFEQSGAGGRVNVRLTLQAPAT